MNIGCKTVQIIPKYLPLVDTAQTEVILKTQGLMNTNRMPMCIPKMMSFIMSQASQTNTSKTCRGHLS